jgi:ABC-2 type transport system ATP-binding protein
MPVAETSGLRKMFGKVQALRHLTLTLEKGVIGLIGPNGAGKTTTIGILLGLLRPDSGSASVFGFDCWRSSFEVRKRVGVLHEKPVYPGGFSGRKYLEHVAKFYGVDRPRERTGEMLKVVGFSDAADRNIGTYSAGMVQRIGLAQALIGEPELVILDEPTANLDPIGRVEFLETIRQLHIERGISFMISTHVLGELEIVCDQVAIINRGVVRAQGKMQELAEKYQPKAYTLVVSNPQLLAKEIEGEGWAKQVKIESGGRVVVETNLSERFQDEVIHIIQAHRLKLTSMGPQYGALEAIYRSVMEEDENVR